MSGFITKIDLHNAITSDLGIPIDYMFKVEFKKAQ